MQTQAIRLLASTNNARGDLFTRLVKDLFFALGYDDLRLDVHKSGREIDVRGTHRFESRDVIAECKAEKEPIGGRDANTFLGVLTRERDRTPDTPIHGYFISLSGFRETEFEQELQTSPKHRIILLTGARVVEELERSRLLIPRADAVERAGRCITAEHTDAVLDGTELLGHSLGYVWAVYYARGKERTHVALIHADGTPLAEAIAREVIQADRKLRGSLHKLTYLGPPTPAVGRTQSIEAVVARYAQWIGEECGFIQLDGLPADTDLSATRLKLERLFVPLNVVLETEGSAADQQPAKGRIVPVGDVLQSDHHLALVAKPGGGKSTLLKRLAVAYAFPARRTESDDALPDRVWLPLFLRCRELRDRIQRPIVELLDDLPRHAGMDPEEAALFRDHVHEALRSREALLLVDGLDEIADEGARQTFAQHLRTFVGMFPNVALIITSREAGFRLVAGVIASVCKLGRLASFDRDDVRRLCEQWHVEVVANTDKVRTEARQLAETIWGNERIRALSENPLMLTTLLVVRRCIGELPTRRVELYREAVRVLIRTWNTEGFAPLDLEEALAQLSYVACAMTEAGQQQIGQKALIRLLHQARQELVPELDFTQTSPEQFIERIEYRSSLLMQTGHAQMDGELQPVYEFRHLTFQEYLTARGLVEEQYPGRNDGHSLVELLEPHFSDEHWREIIPLAAILAGRKADPVIRRLTTTAREMEQSSSEQSRTVHVILLQCLRDEVQVTGATLRTALDQAARQEERLLRISHVDLYRGKFGALLTEVVEAGFFSDDGDWERYLHAMAAAPDPYASELSDDLAVSLEESLLCEDRARQTRAALTCMRLAYGYSPNVQSRRPPLTSPESQALDERFRRLRDALGRIVGGNDLRVAAAAAWALAWTGAARLPNSPPSRDVLLSLYRLWRTGSGELQSLAAWAFETQPLFPRGAFKASDFPDAAAVLKLKVLRSDTGAYVLAWYRREPWDDAELLRRIGELDHVGDATTLELTRSFGTAGEAVLNELLKESEMARDYYQLLDAP